MNIEQCVFGVMHLESVHAIKVLLELESWFLLMALYPKYGLPPVLLIVISP